MPCPYNRKLIEGMGRHPEGKVKDIRNIGNFFPIFIPRVCCSIRRA
ncbi:hypothetical protein [Microseira wollei]|nr:hypothetical protein [Microseira wollei]